MANAQTTPVSEPAQRRADGTGLIALDPWLEPYAEALRRRYEQYTRAREQLIARAGSLDAFARGYEYFGLTRGGHDGRPGVWYREWAPAAAALFLTGDFNGWDRNSHPMQRDHQGVWSIFLPDEEYASRLTHGSKLKVNVHSQLGHMDRIPAWARYVQYEQQTNSFCSLYWNPPEPYRWQHQSPGGSRGNLRIYESHVGMAGEEARIHTYAEFTAHVLPRIEAAGYNAVQLMAVQEHPYYGSFGYHVSSFFAVSSRFGTPEEFKALVDEAHRRGILVLLDLVHSHSVKNVLDGLNRFDGTDHQYFHGGHRGEHPAWDSLLFDYAKPEVLQFLLSNVRFWLDEYRLDGFRLDGVTSMMYLHHGVGHGFNSYDDYLLYHVDESAITYLQLANEVAHGITPHAVTIAEDVSGMVGLCRPLPEGGLGFDYRLAMGLPDYWIKLLKHLPDESWPMGEMFHTLANRRAGEKHVAYAESHDQALVGDKTIAFWLMDADMYWMMGRDRQSLVIDRGIALHKMIRLVTFAAGGEAWLNFMGNEFGHPEWIDFPREGNNFSCHYARRQWSLVDNPDLRYRDLGNFDRQMLALDEAYKLLSDPFMQLIHAHEEQKILIFRRGPLVFVFNWHPSESYRDYRFGVPDPVDYRLILNSDDPWFGGQGRVAGGQVYPFQGEALHGREQSIQIYIPARTAQVLAPR